MKSGKRESSRGTAFRRVNRILGLLLSGGTMLALGCFLRRNAERSWFA
jgi:hypothetical protein